jgi:hypothetical protein
MTANPFYLCKLSKHKKLKAKKTCLEVLRHVLLQTGDLLDKRQEAIMRKK